LSNASLIALYICDTTHFTDYGCYLGSMRCSLLLFKYFLSMSGLSHSCCRWSESKTIVRSKRSLDFVRSRFTRAHPLETEPISAIRHL